MLGQYVKKHLHKISAELLFELHSTVRKHKFFVPVELKPIYSSKPNLRCQGHLKKIFVTAAFFFQNCLSVIWFPRKQLNLLLQILKCRVKARCCNGFPEISYKALYEMSDEKETLPSLRQIRLSPSFSIRQVFCPNGEQLSNNWENIYVHTCVCY